MGGINNTILDQFWWNFNCEVQNEWNNGGTMMYNYGLDHREICGNFLVLTGFSVMCEGRRSLYCSRETRGNHGRVGISSFELQWLLICITSQNGQNNGGIMMYNYGLDHRELGE